MSALRLTLISGQTIAPATTIIFPRVTIANDSNCLLLNLFHPDSSDSEGFKIPTEAIPWLRQALEEIERKIQWQKSSVIEAIPSKTKTLL